MAPIYRARLKPSSQSPSGNKEKYPPERPDTVLMGGFEAHLLRGAGRSDQTPTMDLITVRTSPYFYEPHFVLITMSPRKSDGSELVATLQSRGRVAM